MKFATLSLTLGAALATTACATYGGDNYASTSSADTMANDPAMVSVNVVETIVDSPNHTTLESLVKSAGLVETLAGDGPFTVFAPTDAAFSRVPSQTVTALTQASNREMLSGVLTYHVVSGRFTAQDLTQRISSGGGSTTLTTVQGTQLTASIEGDFVKITDATGATAYVETADLMNSNGVIHSINGVLMPRN